MNAKLALAFLASAALATPAIAAPQQIVTDPSSAPASNNHLVPPLSSAATQKVAAVQQAKTNGSGYLLPPKEVLDVVTAKPSPAVNLSPDGKWMLLMEREAMPDISEFARRMLPLAGMRIDPAANSPFRTRFYHTVMLRQTLANSEGAAPVTIPLPGGSKLVSATWSHTSEHFALMVVQPGGQQLWRVSVSQPTKPELLTSQLSTVMQGPVWLPDGQQILCTTVSSERGAEPKAPQAPKGPNIQQSLGNTSPTRTYQDLLKNGHDEALFAHYMTTQLVRFDVQGEAQPIGKPCMLRSASVAPDGSSLLVQVLQRPFSYLLTSRSFPHTVEVWDFGGKVMHSLASIPLEENIPIGGVRTGPRRFGWMNSRPSTVVWTEALDGGDPKAEVDHRDRLMTLAAPFNGQPKELLKVVNRHWSNAYLANPDYVLVREYDRDRRWLRMQMHNLAEPGAAPITIEDRSMRDRYGNPGSLMTERNANGKSIVRQDGEWVYWAGQGASEKGDLPFLDRQNLASQAKERLWRSGEGSYESVRSVLASADGALPQVITAHETTTSPPNYRLRDLSANSVQPLTQFPDPTPSIRKIKKQLVHYERADGVPLSATLYLPADYEEGTRLPLFIWAYPREFNDAKTAGQVSGSQHRFTRMAGISHLTLVTQGYAVMDGATMPVIGDAETMNDTFIDQIVAAAQAAIDKAVDMGVADRDRVAVGGHSYGAFMTANLLAHCDLFQAGIARSGAYNRTLTPFGFQSERRPFWEAKDVYMGISPFMHADKINEPVLLVHGENDNNSGTFPVQSKRLYQAIKGTGGTVRLCMLPHESHGYRAKQSVLHTQAEMINWLDQYVKGAKQ